jgi:hypothetical protein
MELADMSTKLQHTLQRSKSHIIIITNPQITQLFTPQTDSQHNQLKLTRNYYRSYYIGIS